MDIASHAYLAYGAVFLLAFLEAFPVVGSIIPGSALIIGIAALVPAGTVKLWPLMAAAVAGAIIGDGLPYWMGHRYRDTILTRWPLDRNPRLVAKSRTFLLMHGGKSIFLARFTPAVRGFVPVIAGVIGMPAERFYIVNVLSAFLWAPAHILPGILLGSSAALAGAAAGRLLLVVAVVLALLWLVAAVVRVAVRRGPAFLGAGAAALLRWAGPGDNWLARQVRAIVDPERGEARTLLLWAAVVIAAAWLFLGVLEDVASGDPLVRLDEIIFRALQNLRTPVGDTVMIAITELGDTIVTTSVTIIVFLTLACQRAWRTALYWAAAVGFAATLNTITKVIIHRARPGDFAYEGASSFSFPSGHATVNAVLYVFLAFLITRGLRPKWRLPSLVAAVSFAALIAFSRLYLGAHWFSDVVGSLTFATAWVTVLGLAYVRHREKPLDTRPLAVIAGASLVLIGSFNVLRSHARDTQRYAVRYETPSLAAADWWTTAWQTLPAFRVGLTGEEDEPLILQWAGTLEDLRNGLLDDRWRSPPSWTASGGLAWLVTTDPQELPVVPSLGAGRPPALTMIRPIDAKPDSRFVLRIWETDYMIRNGTEYPLYIGSVVEERISRPLSLVAITRTQTDIRPPFAVLRNSFVDGRVAQREFGAKGWSGQVLLAREGSIRAHPAGKPR